jgi:hypothetical protein
MKERNVTTTTILFVLACFVLLPRAHAVIPAPDGGYPGGNTAEGQSALFSLTTGGYNTAVGYFSLRADAQGQFNTAVGAGALLANVGDPSTGDGTLNTATGAAALLSNTTGSSNTANGAFALFSNTTGLLNTATGRFALYSNTTGQENTANGAGALQSNVTGVGNVAVGSRALRNDVTGSTNTATGWEALSANDGGANSAFGADALVANTSGNSNVAIGTYALFNNNGSSNVAIGAGAGYTMTTGNNVVCVGNLAGIVHQTGDNDVYLANQGVDGEIGTVRLGTGDGVHTRMFLAGVRGVTTGVPDAIPVFIDSAGQLGTASSSRRFKHDIKPMDTASDGILALNPVTFHYKTDKTNTPQFGLIAEEVASVNPDLVVRDDKNEVYTVRYDAVNAMLLNEFLKEHRRVDAQQDKVEKQEATITELRSTVAQQLKAMEVLTTQLKEQASQIQKVSAQVRLSENATQTIAEKE